MQHPAGESIPRPPGGRGSSEKVIFGSYSRGSNTKMRHTFFLETRAENFSGIIRSREKIRLKKKRSRDIFFTLWREPEQGLTVSRDQHPGKAAGMPRAAKIVFFMGICRQRETKAANLCKAFPRRPLAALFLPGKVFRMKPNTRTQTAAPKSERGTAPEIFATVLQHMIREAEEFLDECPEDQEIFARQRLGILSLAASSNLPFRRFRDELYYTAAPEVMKRFEDMLDTLSAFADVCFDPEKLKHAEGIPDQHGTVFRA